MNGFTNSTCPRLLLLAHSCNPEIGSEPGMGWNRALQAAKDFETWVICDTETNQAPIERYLAKHGPIHNLQFAFVSSSRMERKLRRLPGTFWVRYNLWHRHAYRAAHSLHRQFRFDLIHQLNLCGFREPGYLWKLDAPFIWGPFGGAQNYPWRFLRGAGVSGAISEAFRNILNTWQMRFGRRVGKAARRAAVVLAATTTNARSLARRCISPPRVLLETGVHTTAQPQRNFDHSGALRILWSGVFEHRKALHLLLEAVAELPAEVVGEIRILGRGPLDARWKKIAKKLGVESRCRWLGWLDQPQALEEFRGADVFAFTSLRDTSGNVVLESFAAGTPVVFLDHQCVADMVTGDCGVKLTVTNPRDVVRRLRETLVRLHLDRDELARLSQGAIRRAEHYAWNRQGERMAAIYREVLGIHNSASGDSPAEHEAVAAPAGDELPALCGTSVNLLAERRA
jgi:glycosyltransferase involved in cell wall biosynthesis